MHDVPNAELTEGIRRKKNGEKCRFASFLCYINHLTLFVLNVMLPVSSSVLSAFNRERSRVWTVHRVHCERVFVQQWWL